MIECKKRKLIVRGLKIFIGIIVSCLIIYIFTVIYFRVSMLRKIRVENGSVIYNQSFIKREITELKKVETTYKSEKINIDDIKLKFKGKTLNILEKFELNQRYYVPLDQFLDELSISYKNIDNINYNIEDVYLNLDKKTYLKNDIYQNFRGEVQTINNKIYISINDLENILDLSSTWSYDEKYIDFYKKVKIQKVINRETANGKAAVLRLEDVSASNDYANNKAVQQMKSAADYFYQEGIIPHIAWIPRFKDPGQNIDNNLLTNQSMGNAQFINMLDYYIYRGAVIGLHGYTHQFKEETTAIGADLSRIANPNEIETRNILENTIQTANILNIPYSFFESGHYQSTKKQQKIIEEYFDICFEPYKYYWNFDPLISKRNNSTLYIPTPLSYSKTDDGRDLVKRIETNNNVDIVLSAFFIHPTKFKEFFDIIYEDDIAINIRKENSPIENIVEALNKSGHVTININDLK